MLVLDTNHLVEPALNVYDSLNGARTRVRTIR